MCRKITLLSVFLFSSLFALAQVEKDFSLENIVELGLPIIEITTKDGKEPTCEYIAPPEGCIGSGITNAVKIEGRVRVLKNGKPIFDSGIFEKGKAGMKIKIRGNSSARADKKAFKIKLEKKADLLMRENKKQHEDKNWVLLKNDVLSLNTLIGFKIDKLLNRGWSPSGKYVNVMFNGDYRGIYMLAESIERNADSRINVDKKTGYIIEEDPYWWNEEKHLDKGYLESSFLNYMRYTFKYPDDKDLTPKQQEEIQADVIKMEKAIENGSYQDEIDVRSFALWLLAHDILGDKDSAGSNMYLTKYDNTANSLFQMGPLWDFDAILTTEEDWARIHNEYYFDLLFKSSNKTFFNTYNNLIANEEKQIIGNMVAFLKDYSTTEEYKGLEKSYPMDWKRWENARYYGKGKPLDITLQNAITWFQKRGATLNKLWETSLGIKEVSKDKAQSDDAYYNIMGQRIQPNAKGIVIHKGRKLYKR